MSDSASETVDVHLPQTDIHLCSSVSLDIMRTMYVRTLATVTKNASENVGQNVCPKAQSDVQANKTQQNR